MVGTEKAFEVPLSPVTLTDSLIAVWFGRGWGKPRRCALLSGTGGGAGVREAGQSAQWLHLCHAVPTIGKFPLENIPLINPENLGHFKSR